MSEKLPLGPQDENWKGYTIDELRYRRAYTVARIEIEKERLRHNLAVMQEEMKAPALTRNIFNRVMGSLSYIDLGVMVFRLARRATKSLKRAR